MMKLGHTIFVANVLHRKEAALVSQVIQRCKTAEYRVWLKSMEGIYPVQTYLHRGITALRWLVCGATHQLQADSQGLVPEAGALCVDEQLR